MKSTKKNHIFSKNSSIDLQYNLIFSRLMSNRQEGKNLF